MAENQEEELTKEVIGKGGAAPKGKPAVWLGMLLAVVVLCSTGGFVVGSLLRKAPAEPPKAPTAVETAAKSAEPTDHQESEYYSFDPFTVTLDTPRRDRFFVVTIILAFNQGDKKAVVDLLEKKKREVRSRLSIYLSSRSLEDVSGAKNLKRVLREIQDSVNEYLWPGEKPMVTEVLFNNPAIQ